MSRNGSAIGLALAAWLAIGVAGSAADYEIRLDRRFTVGDELGIVATAKAAHAEKVVAEGKAVEDNKAAMQVRLEADARVLAVDKAGHLARVAYTVRNFEGSIDGKKVEPVPKGAVIIAEAGKPFRLESGELAEPMGELLDLILKVKAESDPGDDEPFGTPERKKVGDQWPVSRAAVVKGLAANGMKATEDAVSGTVKLTGMEDVGGVPCLMMEAQVDAKGFDPGLPPGGKIISSSMSVRTTGDFPMDLSLPRLKETVSFQVAIRGTVSPPEGPAMSLEISGSQEVTRTFSIAAPTEEPMPLDAGHRLPWLLDGSRLLERQAEGIDLKGNKGMATKQARFFEDDFVIDLVFTLRADDGIANIGFDAGSGKAHAHLRLHPPRFAPSGVDLWLPGVGNMGLARNTGAGEYLVRIDRKGDALTFAVDAQYDGAFKPDVERTIPDIRAVGARLTAGNARLFFANGGLYKSIRLGKAPSVEFDPADPIYAKLERAKADHAKATAGRLADAMLANAYRIAIRDYAAAGNHDLAEALEAEMDRLGFAAPTPAPKPGTADAAQPEAVAKEVSARLGGRGRFPSWLVAQGPILAGKTGLRTQGRHYIRSRDGGFLGRDFVFEVVYSLGTSKEGDGVAFVGLGEGGNRSPSNEPSGSVNLRIHPADLGGGEVMLSKAGPASTALVGKIGKPGTHRAIIEKKGNSVAFAIDAGNDGPSPDDISKTIADIRSFAPFLKDTNTHLFLGGGGEYLGVRIEVKKPTPPEAVAEGAFVRLGGRLGLAPYLVAQGPVFATKAGVQTHGRHYIRTKDGDFLGRDFTFDVVFSLRTRAEGDGPAFFGLGEGGNRGPYGEPSGSIDLRVYPCDLDGGAVALGLPGPTGRIGIGKIAKAGTHRATIAKKGNQVAFAIDVGNDGPSPDDLERTVLDLKGLAPFLNETNTHLFFGSEGTYEQVRLSVAKLTPTPAGLPADKLYRTVPGEPVPPYLVLAGAPLAEKDGIPLKDRVLATRDASFFEKDFVIDLVFAIAPDDGIMCIEFGDKGSNKHLLLRLHPPKFAPQGVDLSKDAVRYEGVCLNTGACDHMLRIERKGNAITYSLDAPYDGTFKPEAFKRVDDITTYVPYLNAKTAILRLRHGGIVKQIQLRESGGTIPEVPEATQPQAKEDEGEQPKRPPKKGKSQGKHRR